MDPVVAIVFGAVAVIGTITAIIISIRAASRASKKEEAETGKTSGVLMTEIGYIKSGVDDIKRRQDRQDQAQSAFLERLVCVEQATKSAHHRIDEHINNH